MFFARQAAARESAERSKQLELRIAQQQERAANAERALLEIKERHNDRQFTDQQYLSLVQALANYRDKMAVQLMFIDDREPKRFAELLAEVFDRAGGGKVEIVKWNRPGMLTAGVLIESASGDARANAAARYVRGQLQVSERPHFQQ